MVFVPSLSVGTGWASGFSRAASPFSVSVWVPYHNVSHYVSHSVEPQGVMCDDTPQCLQGIRLDHWLKHLTRNEKVVSSILTGGSYKHWEIPEISARTLAITLAIVGQCRHAIANQIALAFLRAAPCSPKNSGAAHRLNDK